MSGALELLSDSAESESALASQASGSVPIVASVVCDGKRQHEVVGFPCRERHVEPAPKGCPLRRPSARPTRFKGDPSLLPIFGRVLTVYNIYSIFLNGPIPGIGLPGQNPERKAHVPPLHASNRRPSPNLALLPTPGAIKFPSERPFLRCTRNFHRW